MTGLWLMERGQFSVAWGDGGFVAAWSGGSFEVGGVMTVLELVE